MRLIRYIIISAISFVLCGTGYVYGEEEDISKAQLLAEIRGLKAKVAELETRVKGLEGTETKMPSCALEGGEAQPLGGLRIGAGATFIVQGTVEANNNTSGGEDVMDASYSADIGI